MGNRHKNTNDVLIASRSNEHFFARCRTSASNSEHGSGGGEIRTHETFRPSGFQDRRDQPLCHPSGVTHWRSEIHYPITALLKVK